MQAEPPWTAWLSMYYGGTTPSAIQQEILSWTSLSDVLQTALEFTAVPTAHRIPSGEDASSANAMPCPVSMSERTAALLHRLGTRGARERRGVAGCGAGAAGGGAGDRGPHQCG